MAKSPLLIGPFAEIHERMSEFSYNMFSSFLIQESIDKLDKARIAYDEAVDMRDDDEIIKRKREFEAMQSSFYIATQLSQYDEVIQ